MNLGSLLSLMAYLTIGVVLLSVGIDMSSGGDFSSQLAQVVLTAQQDEIIKTHFAANPPPFCPGMDFETCGSHLQNVIGQNPAIRDQVVAYLSQIPGLSPEIISKIVTVPEQNSAPTPVVIEEPKSRGVNQEEIVNVRRTAKDLRREITGAMNRAKKVGANDAIAGLNELVGEIGKVESGLASGSDEDKQDAIREFWDIDPWQRFSEIDRPLRLGPELKNIGRSLGKAGKTASSKRGQKVLKLLAVDPNCLSGALAEAQGVYSQGDAALKAGDYEEADANLQELHQMDIFRIEGLLNDFNYIVQSVGRKPAVLEPIKAILNAEVIPHLCQGDFRDAGEGYDENRRQIDKLIEQTRRRQGAGLGRPSFLAQVAEVLPEASSEVADDASFNEEVQNILGHINDTISNSYVDLQKKLKRAAKLPGIGIYLNRFNDHIAFLEKTRGILTSAADDFDKREAMDEYNQIDWPGIDDVWEAANIAEELPRATKFSSNLVKVIDKFNKSPQLAGLIGLDLGRLQAGVNESVNVVNQIKSLVNAGNLEEAIEVVREEKGPLGRIESYYHPTRDFLEVASRTKRLMKRNPQVSERIKGLLVPALADFYEEPGEAQIYGENGNGIMGQIWQTLETAEQPKRR